MNGNGYAYRYGKSMAHYGWTFSHALNTLAYSTIDDSDVDEYIRGFADHRDRGSDVIYPTLTRV